MSASKYTWKTAVSTEFHRQRSLAGDSPRGHKESGTNLWLNNNNNKLYMPKIFAGIYHRTILGFISPWHMPLTTPSTAKATFASAITKQCWSSLELTSYIHNVPPRTFLPNPISTYNLITMNQQFFSQVSWPLPFHQFLALIL